MKAILVLISILVMGNSARAQVDWIRFASLSDSMRETPKPIVVFIHAPWCNYCKMMQKFVFKDDVISRQLNQNFYSIALDHEHLYTSVLSNLSKLYPQKFHAQ